VRSNRQEMVDRSCRERDGRATLGKVIGTGTARRSRLERSEPQASTGLGSGGTVVAMGHGISAPRDADAMSLESDDAHVERWRSEFMVLRPDVYGVQLRQTMFDELSAELGRSVRSRLVLNQLLRPMYVAAQTIVICRLAHNRRGVASFARMLHEMVTLNRCAQPRTLRDSDRGDWQVSGFRALVLLPWARLGGGAAGEGWAEPAEVEHGESDEGVGGAEPEGDAG
jgi:hypothetical protein